MVVLAIQFDVRSGGEVHGQANPTTSLRICAMGGRQEYAGSRSNLFRPWHEDQRRIVEAPE
jgi:hypothetical protein